MEEVEPIKKENFLKAVFKKVERLKKMLDGSQKKEAMNYIFTSFLEKFKEIKTRLLKNELTNDDIDIIKGYLGFWERSAEEFRKRRDFKNYEEYNATAEITRKVLAALKEGNNSKTLVYLDANIMDIETTIKTFLSD